MSPEARRCLSIQSFVAVGYVGNKCAIPCLQLLGFEVDAVNTVEFSNHTGYRQWGGTKLSVEHLQSLFDAFEKNGFAMQTHLLTGYVPGPEALTLVSVQVDRLRKANPDLVFLCDPVMGDDGHMYVAPECLDLYKQILPKATVTTPNDYEVELLTGIKIHSLATLRTALEALHAHFGLPHAVVSSCRLEPQDLQHLSSSAQPRSPMLVCAGSSMVDGKMQAFAIVFPELAEHYEGVGDAFSALVLGHFACDKRDAPTSLARSAEMAIASLSAIIARTHQQALALASGDASALQPSNGEEPLSVRAERLRRLELRLIQSRADILDPKVRYRAVPI